MYTEISIALQHIEDIVKTAELHHDANGNSTQTLYSMDIFAMECLLANTSILSASQDMYEALKSCRNALEIIIDTDKPVDTRRRIERANEALAKADNTKR